MVDYCEGLCVAEYVLGRVDVSGLERALDHVYAGGVGCEEFPFLPMFVEPDYEEFVA